MSKLLSLVVMKMLEIKVLDVVVEVDLEVLEEELVVKVDIATRIATATDFQELVSIVTSLVT